jgi:hypothetical protein
MDRERDRANSPRLANLPEKFQDKQYRDGYVAAHTRGVLARQMRNFRGELSQQDFAPQIGKQKTVIARLENPAYGGWSLRTMLDVAREKNVALFCRFVDFPTFLKYTNDLSDEALLPDSYNQAAVDALAEEEKRRERERELRALFVDPQPSESPETVRRMDDTPRTDSAVKPPGGVALNFTTA